MRSRHAVLLTAPAADVCLPPVYHEQRRATPPESTPIEVFIPGDLNLFRINADWGTQPFAQFSCNASPFRINTCKSVSKQRTLSPFRINRVEKSLHLCFGWVEDSVVRSDSRGFGVAEASSKCGVASIVW